MLNRVNEHKGLISDLQTSKDETMVITASKDTSAKVNYTLYYVCMIYVPTCLMISCLMLTSFNYSRRTGRNVQSIQPLYHLSRIM